MEDEEKIPLLKNEYLVLQKAYEDFGARLMTIKRWIATVAIALYLSPLKLRTQTSNFRTRKSKL